MTYVESLVTDQEARKASLESRGLSVVTTSGAIVTLLFGLVALVTKATGFALPNCAYGPLGVALVFFTAAAVLGVLTNAPMSYENVDLEEASLWKWWEQDATKSRERITATRLKIFKTAQKKNDLKGRFLIAAVVCEVVAVASLAVTVGVILHAAP